MSGDVCNHLPLSDIFLLFISWKAKDEIPGKNAWGKSLEKVLEGWEVTSECERILRTKHKGDRSGTK